MVDLASSPLFFCWEVSVRRLTGLLISLSWHSLVRKSESLQIFMMLVEVCCEISLAVLYTAVPAALSTTFL